MKRNKLIAAIVAGALAIGSIIPTDAFAGAAPVPGATFGSGPTGVPVAIFGCAGGIILAALVANARDNRELTAPEAWSCGFLFWFSPPQPKRVKKHR